MTRTVAALLLTLALASCSSWPGAQTLGVEDDPHSEAKALLIAMSMTVDAVGVYGHLCAPVVTPACKSPKSYENLKRIAGTIVQDADDVVSGRMSPTAAIVIFAFTQYALVKTAANSTAPTNPQATPDEAAIAYIRSIAAGDMLISAASAKVRAAMSVNTTPAQLMVELRAKLAALP